MFLLQALGTARQEAGLLAPGQRAGSRGRSQDAQADTSAIRSIPVTDFRSFWLCYGSERWEEAARPASKNVVRWAEESSEQQPRAQKCERIHRGPSDGFTET